MIIDPFRFSSFDADAQAFFAATSLVDATQRTAVNQLVLDLKAASIWSKFSTLYPFVGGDATKHSCNLVNPATYQITWHGTVTHNANGITGDGPTGYGDTGFNPATLALNSAHLALYSRSSTGGNYLAGSITGTTTYTIYGPDGGTVICDLWDQGGNGRVGGSVTGPQGLLTINRSSATALKFFRGGTIVGGNSNDASSAIRPTDTTYICGANSNGSPLLLSNLNFALMSMGAGMSDAEMSAYAAAVQAFQTALGRNV